MAVIYRPDLNASAFTPVTATNDDGSSVQALALVTSSATASGATPPAGTTSDPTSQRSIGSVNLATSQVSVATTATQIVAARAGRNAVTITNITGAQQVYVGAAGVTAANGALIPATVGASITVPTSAAVFGIALTAAQTVSALETY